MYGAYYIGAARDDAGGAYPANLYRSTIWGRLALSVAFCVLVLVRQCEPPLLLLAGANAASSWVLQRAVSSRQQAGGS